MRTDVNKARVGRPPDTDSAETRRRILDVARTMFAERGYESTTNRLLAAAADLTAGAVYHHYGSKLAVYVAVQEDAMRQVFDRFSAAIAERPTFLAQVEALLDEAHAMNVQDPSLARFLGALRVDVQRHPHIGEAVEAREQVTSGMVEGIVDLGISTGELSRDDRQAVVAMLRAFLVGLTDAMSIDSAQHLHAINGMKKLLEGRLTDPQTSFTSGPG